MLRTDFLRLLGIGTGAAVVGLTLPKPKTELAEPWTLHVEDGPTYTAYPTVEPRHTAEDYLSDIVERECAMRPRRLEIMDLPNTGSATKKMIWAQFDGSLPNNPASVFRKIITVGGPYHAVTGKNRYQTDEMAYQLVKRAKEIGRDASMAYETGPYWEKRMLREFMNRGPANA